MTINIAIRMARQSDIAVLTNFNIAMALETENLTLEPSTVHQGVSRLLQQPNYGFYLVAETHEGDITGSLMITFEWSDWRNGLIWWIQSVYVHPDHRRQGVYRQLFDTVKEQARENGDIPAIRLYVEKDNSPAQKTYQQLGMSQTHYRLYEISLDREISE